MSLWVRSFLTKPIDLKMEEFEHALDGEDFGILAEWQELGEDDAIAAQNSLRFQKVKRRSFPFCATVHYRHHQGPERQMYFELWDDPKKVKSEIDEALESDPPAKVKKLLSKVKATTAFELKVDDKRGMGWPISYQLSLWLAQRGKGLVEHNGIWWDPETREEL